MKKTIEIDGKSVMLKSSAAIPRIYRSKFGRDIFKDMMQLQKSLKRKKHNKGELTIESLEMFENIAYVMAKHADPNVPDNVLEWMDQFKTFSIYQVLPEIMELWELNNVQMEKSKKKGKISIVK